jgi:serine protease Do
MHRLTLNVVVALSIGAALAACNRNDASAIFGGDAHAGSLPANAAPAPRAVVAAATPSAQAPATNSNNEYLAPMPSLAPLVRRLRPVVVNITSKYRPRHEKRSALSQRSRLNNQDNEEEQDDGQGGQGGQGGDEQERMEKFFRFFGGRGQQMPEDNSPRSGLGSGFLIGNGLVITNNHVVQIQDSQGGRFRPMDEIKIITDDNAQGGARSYPAKLVGADPKSDIALLKIEDPRGIALAGAALGDSDALEVGDYVVAIGEPFGLQATVTAGIISAKERSAAGGINGAYSDYLQTDAAINPGNSGGPLFNLRGEVIGVNSAILSGANTVGFAIPIAVVKQILPELREKGRVVRGFLGVSLQPLTQDTAEQLGLKSTQGALVADVIKDGAADKAGLHAGDVVTSIEGKPVADNNVLMRQVGSIPPGKKITLVAVREGREKSFSVELDKRPEDKAEAMNDAQGPTAPNEGDPLGIVVETMTPDLARRAHVDAQTKGVVVTDIQPDSPNAGEGLEPGDVLVEVNRTPIATVADYRKALKGLKPGSTALLRVKRGTQAEYLTVRVPG